MIPVWHATTAQQAIPGSRVKLFEGAGHFPHLEQPERFARLLGEFMAGSAAGTGVVRSLQPGDPGDDQHEAGHPCDGSRLVQRRHPVGGGAHGADADPHRVAGAGRMT